VSQAVELAADVEVEFHMLMVMHQACKDCRTLQGSWLAAVLVLAPVAVGAQGVFHSADLVPLGSRPTSLRVDDYDRDGRPDLAVAQESSGKVSVLLNDAVQSPGPLFDEPRSYDVGLSPLFVTSGDVDGKDGPDLIVVNSGSSTVSVLLNQGDGNFLLEADFSTGIDPRVAALADFDRDGDLDVVSGNAKSKDLILHLGNGRGRFDEGGRFRIGGNPHSIGTEDFDGDGLLDIVAVYANGPVGGVNWLAGRPGGTFADGVRTGLDQDGDLVPRFLATGDFDQDGRPDLAVLTDQDRLLFLRLRPDGTFDVEIVATVPISVARFLTAADFDHDGLVDLVAPISPGNDFGIRVYRSAGDGSFAAMRDIFLDGTQQDLCLHDVDGDGVLDLLGAQQNPRGIAVIRGNGHGLLRGRATTQLGSAPRGLAALDVDRDGESELMVASYGSLDLLEANGDGGFEVLSAQDFSEFTFEDIAAADLNGDGTHDLALVDVAGGEVVTASVDTSGNVIPMARYAVHPFPQGLVLGDFDQDGAPDLAVTHAIFPSVSVALNSALEMSGSEGSPFVDIPVGSGQTSCDSADVDGDGFLDLAIGTTSGIKLLLGNGKGAFPTIITLGDYSGPRALRVVDLDADSTADLVFDQGEKLVAVYAPAMNPGGEHRSVEVDLESQVQAIETYKFDEDVRPIVVTAIRNTIVVVRDVSAEGLSVAERYVVGGLPRALVLDDLTGRGRLDCTTIDFDSKAVTLLYGSREVNAHRVFRRGDVDADSVVVLTDAIRLLEWLFQGGERPGCADSGDLDDNGAVDLTDVIVLVAYLFRGAAEPGAPGPHACGLDPTEDTILDCTAECR